MAFILGVGRKTAGQPRGRFAANFGVFIQAWGIRNDLESIWKCFSFGKIRNPRKILHGIIVEFSRKFQFPVFSTRPEVENTTLHNPKVNSIHPQSFIQIGSRVSEILQPTPKMNAILIPKIEIFGTFFWGCLKNRKWTRKIFFLVFERHFTLEHL